MKRLLVSFSGGETSAYMTWRILHLDRAQFGEVLVVFANTGQENEATLEFVRDCDEKFGFGTVWIEAVQNFGERKSADFRVVDFASADRTGRTFEDYIRKYGIPNKAFPGCTRDLKLNPITAYAESIGWASGTYKTAIGIRADELDRISINAAKNGIIYPLIRLRIRKPQINEWWMRQDFRLRLKGYQGNCKWCWKKSFRKHLTIIGESPEKYEFPRRMERQYGHIGAEFAKEEKPDYDRRTFFRGHRSTDDVFAMYDQRGDDFIPAEDDAIVLPDQPGFFDPDLDEPGGCGESCEVWTDDMDEAA